MAECETTGAVRSGRGKARQVCEKRHDTARVANARSRTGPQAERTYESFRRVAQERDPKAYTSTPSGARIRISPKAAREHGCLKRDRTFGKHGTSTAVSSSQWSGVRISSWRFYTFFMFHTDETAAANRERSGRDSL